MKNEFFDASALLQDVFGTDRPVPLLDPQANYLIGKIEKLDDDIVTTIVGYYPAQEHNPNEPEADISHFYSKEELLDILRHHLSEDICLLSMKSHDAIISGYIRQHEEIAKLRAQLAEKAKGTEVTTDNIAEEQNESLIADDAAEKQDESPATQAYNFATQGLLHIRGDYIGRQVEKAIDNAYEKAQAENMSFLETLELFQKGIDIIEEGFDRDIYYGGIKSYLKRRKQLSQYQTIDINWLYLVEGIGRNHMEELEKVTKLENCSQYFCRLGRHLPYHIGEIIEHYLKEGSFTDCINVGQKRSDKLCEFIHTIFTDEQISELKFRKYHFQFGDE